MGRSHGPRPPPRPASQEPRDLTQAKAIFLHTGWRSSGTWLWAKLRTDARKFALYEPLHEVLATLNPRRIAANVSNSWASGHTPTTPYFAEYAHLLKPLGGVRNFQRRFSYERYFLQPSDRDDELKTYLDSLLQAAAAHQQTPVLKFCRSLGRTSWMQEQFPDALHAVVLRNPAAQFHSSVSQMAKGNRFFMMAPLLVLARNRTNPLVAEATERFGIKLPALPLHTRQLDGEVCWRYMTYLDEASRYRSFMAFWTVTALTALSAPGVLIIDVDELQQASPHRLVVEAALHDSGTDVTLVADTPASPRAAPPDAGRIHAAAVSLLDANTSHLSEPARAAITAKLSVGASDTQHAETPCTSWRDAGAADAVKRAKLSLYFAAIGASMPFRRLHGSLRSKGMRV